MNSRSIKLLQNTVKNITKKLLLPAFVFLSLPASLVEAQITPDGTLETQVEIIQQLMEINGGLREGNNLFHSFSEFNIPEGMEASFQNAIDIENIFTRVTGDSISNINGILSTQGAANFFLMNPNGIVFGENASINVGGSFMATTADSINFEDGMAFAASDTSADPILTTDQPSGFTFDGQPGAIQVYGEGSLLTSESLREPTEIERSSTGLQVNNDRTLALIGNSVNLEGGIITTEGGRIEIGSVQNGYVGISENLELSYNDVNNFGAIELGQQSLINTTDANSDGGSIAIRGANLFLNDGSKILLQNENGTLLGDLDITSESVVLEGTSPNGEVGSGIQAQTTSTGKASNINLNIQRVVLKDGARISSNTYNDGSGGNVNVDASNSIEIIENPSNIISASTYASGNAGSINLSTNSLRVTAGGGVSSSTLGAGDGGNLNVRAKDIELIGNLSEPDSLSAISAVSFSTQGNAGNIKVDTNTLKISDGGAVSTTSIGDGAAGNVAVNASDSIIISGQTEAFPSFIGSSVTAQGDPEFRALFGIPEIPGGASGNVDVNTSSLQIVRGGEVSVENEGSGNAGILSINAENINLNNSGSVNAESAFGQGGNINLNTDNLQIDNESSIAATAENEAGGGNITINASNITAKKDSAISANATGGDGGNVSINSEILLGIDNSDLTANAIEGDGGNITINADFIIGFEERARLTPFNDIVASSEFGQSGTININSPESTAEEDLTVNAKEIESVEAGEFLKAVCPNPDNRYGKKTFQYYARGVPEGLGNYHDYDEEEILKDLPVHQKIERETYRHSTEPPSLPDADSIPDTYPDYPDRTFEGRAEPVVAQFPYTTSPLQVIYSQTNQVPPTPRPRKPGEPALEANAVQINPDGSKHFIRVAQIEHPQEQMCVRSDRLEAKN